MNRLHEVTDALLRILKDEVPEVDNWRYAVIGFNRSKQVEGTLSCDTVRFTSEDKDADMAVATYRIYIIMPDVQKMLEDVAFKTRAALRKNYDLDQWATDSMVKSIMFGVAQGQKDAGVAVIEYEVKFDMKESE